MRRHLRSRRGQGGGACATGQTGGLAYRQIIDLGERIAAVLPRDICTVRLTTIDHIPRTPLGKPQRERLRESAARLAVGQ